MQETGRILIIVGMVLLLAGALVLGLSKLGIGRLPGDFSFTVGKVKVYLPLMTSLILSLLLSLIVWLWRR